MSACFKSVQKEAIHFKIVEFCGSELLKNKVHIGFALVIINDFNELIEAQSCSVHLRRIGISNPDLQLYSIM